MTHLEGVEDTWGQGEVGGHPTLMAGGSSGLESWGEEEEHSCCHEPEKQHMRKRGNGVCCHDNQIYSYVHINRFNIHTQYSTRYSIIYYNTVNNTYSMTKLICMML